MQGMFNGCNALKALDLSGFDTSRVEDMEDMLRSCSSLQTLDLTPLDTSHVTDMRSMFYACEGLEAVDMSTLDTSSLTNTYWMFGCCYHWLFFQLQETHNNDLRNIKKIRKHKNQGQEPKNPLTVLEWEAKQGAQALMLPERMLRPMIEQYYNLICK